jgi:hypothetical protein
MVKNNVREPRSEPRLVDLLRPPSFVASLEELAKFLIATIVDAEPKYGAATEHRSSVQRDRALEVTAGDIELA